MAKLTKETGTQPPTQMHRASREVVEVIVKECRLTAKYFDIIKRRTQRRRVLHALEMTRDAVIGLFHLIDYDGRFAVTAYDKNGRRAFPRKAIPVPMEINFLSRWIQEIAPEGQWPDLPLAMCADRIATVFRHNHGGPHWECVAKIIAKEFGDRLEKRRKSKMRKSEAAKSNAKDDWQSSAEWIRDYVKDNKRWWRKFTVRTDAWTPAHNDPWYERFFPDPEGKDHKQRAHEHALYHFERRIKRRNIEEKRLSGLGKQPKTRPAA